MSKFNNKKQNEIKRNFLLSFFDEDEYCEKEMGGFWLVKSWNNDYKLWQVAVFPPESFAKYKKFKQHSGEFLPVIENGTLEEIQYYKTFNDNNPDYWLPL